MSKVKIILALGIWTALLPYLGFPYSLKNTLFSITGLVFVYLSFTLYKELKVREGEQKTFDNFSENSNFNENNIDKEESIDSGKE